MSFRHTVFARWLWPGISLVLVGGGLTFLVLQRQPAKSQGPAEAAVEAERPYTPLATATNPPPVNPETTHTPEPESSEDRVVALVSEGNQLLERGQYAEAAGKYEQAVRIEPGGEDLHYNLAIALAKLGKIEEARKHYTEALQIYPEYAEARNNLGNLAMKENKLTEAIDQFQEAIKLMPENASFHNNLGTALARQGKVAEATAEFSEAVKLMPGYVEARVNLGNSFLAAGRLEEAIVQLNEALRLRPGYPPALQAMHRARQRQASSGEGIVK